MYSMQCLILFLIFQLCKGVWPSRLAGLWIIYYLVDKEVRHCQQGKLETWKETVLLPTLARYSPNDTYKGDETALFYKSLPHRTYCFDGDKPAGSAKRKDRLTLRIITIMDGSDHRKLSVIGKSKTPCCLQKKYKMQVKDMSVDWYASKNAWMTGIIHHQIMTKLNNEMRISNSHILYVCDNASSHQV